jgi:hypothetical protein
MPQPQAYERQTDFTERDGDDTDHAALNQELDAAALSIEGIRDNLALIQKDDGALKNGIVTPESLAPETFTALQGDVADAVADAQAAATSALTSATTANTARDAAALSATAAQTSQTAAALNAGTASTAAGAATGAQAAVAASAAAALVSENNADTSEAAALASANAAAASAASALADKNAGAASAAAALVSANNADTSEAAALASQNAAATSATNAGNSQTAAAASQAAAAASAALIGITGPSGPGLVPVGATFFFPSTTPPPGFLKKNGALLSRTTYANLYAFALASGNMAANDGAWQAGKFSPGDGATTFRIPDGRAEFLRGWDDSRGVDAGRGIGDWQAGQNEIHSHVLSARNYVYERGSGGAGGYGAGTTLDREAGGLTASSGGSEARPRNVAELACIKY